MKDYTVLLLFPRDISDGDYGHSTYMSSARAKSPENALTAVRRTACLENEQPVNRADDFYCLMVVEGQHRDVNPER